MAREDLARGGVLHGRLPRRQPGLPPADLAHVEYTRTAINWYLRQRYSRDQLPMYVPFGETPLVRYF